MSWSRLTRPALLPFALLLAAVSPASPEVAPVSPGAADRLVEVTSVSPTFSWSGAAGATAYELAVLDVTDAERPVLVLSRRIAGAALSWTPALDESLAPGRTYAWLIRAELGSGEPGEWSAPRRFRVPGTPSPEELTAALGVLERWRAGQAATAAGAAGSPTSPGLPAAAAQGTGEPDAPLATGVAAIRGEIPDTTGSAFGVLGITGSPQGAGVVARNQSVGPDLILDGEAQGEPDTLLTQSGLDRPSASGATFNFQNSGAGALTLQVDGVAVDTANTPIDWARLASVPAGFADGVDNDTTYTAGNQLELAAGNEFNVLEGPGSGLSADTLDGLHAGEFAASAHSHAGEAITSGTVADARIASTLARDSEVMTIVLANDGEGSGLDADTLDGVQRWALQGRVTGTCPDGQAMQGVNADGSVDCYEVPVPPKIASFDSDGEQLESTSLAIGADGFPVISYFAYFGSRLHVVKCNDAACAGAGETFSVVDDAGSVGGGSSLAIGNDGNPVISYHDSGAGALKVAKCNDPACAGGDETITTVDDPVNSVGTYTSIAIGTDGFPVISYRDTTAHALKVAKCNNASCTLTTITTVDDPGNQVGAFTSIAIGADGRPVISYYDTTASALKVAKCNDAACAGGNETITTVDNPTLQDVGVYTSIAIGTDGFPVIAYYHASFYALRVAKCNDAACAGGNETITTVDNPADGSQVGLETSLAIGTDGFPVISYHDSTASALKVAKCNDAACAGGDETITTVDDPANTVGRHTSIAIGTDGFPVVSNTSIGADGALRVVKCMNSSCRY